MKSSNTQRGAGRGPQGSGPRPSPKPVPPPRQHDVTCTCGAKMVLRVAKKASGPLQGKSFYGCSRYPNCKVTHGAHPDGAPLGIPGDDATKAARIQAHAAFDSLWKSGADAVMRRGGAYGWLEEVLGLKPGEGHIGRFDVVTCERVVAAVAENLPVLRQRAEVRRALARRFGSEGSTIGRVWLGEAMGITGNLHVRSLTLEQCAQAVVVLASDPRGT